MFTFCSSTNGQHSDESIQMEQRDSWAQCNLGRCLLGEVGGGVLADRK